MSHIVSIDTQVRDSVAISLACERLQLPPPRQGTFELFGGQASGWSVQLSGWRFPLVAQTETGTLRYDNYQGQWGSQKELDGFLQAYAVEKAKLEARRKGFAVSEQALADGSIKLTIQVAGGAA